MKRKKNVNPLGQEGEKSRMTWVVDHLSERDMKWDICHFLHDIWYDNKEIKQKNIFLAWFGDTRKKKKNKTHIYIYIL